MHRVVELELEQPTMDLKFFNEITITVKRTHKNLVPCGTDGRLLLSGFEALVTSTLDRVIRHTVMHHSWTSIYRMSLKSEKLFSGWTNGRVQGRMTQKSRTNIKTLARSNLDIVLYFTKQWSFASSHCKWQRR